MRKTKTYLSVEKTVNLTLFISLAITLSLFDNLLPINFIIPGMKLGLANLVIVLLLPYYRFHELVMIQVLRVTITAFILGLFSIYFFSLSGALFALGLMYGSRWIFKTKITYYTVSMIGAIGHNAGQICFAIIYFRTPELVYYLPFLVLFGSITGFFLGHVITMIAPLIEGRFNVKNI